MTSTDSAETSAATGAVDPADSVESAESAESAESKIPPEPAELLTKRLSDRFDVRRLRDETTVRTYLDTSDRRLVAADLLLFHDGAGRRLVLDRPGGDRVEQSPAAISWPARLEGIPDGPVRQAITKAIGVRALLPYAALRVATTSYAVLDREGKTVARVHRSSGRIVGQDSPLPDRIDVERLRGYTTEAERVEKRLRLHALPSAATVWAATIRALPVPGQPPERSAPMTAHQSAAVAVAGALLDNLGELEASVDGIRRDLDIEYLHDFRVAVRRSRSVLKLLGDVLPGDVTARGVEDLRWLGQVTTPARDLDVYLEELPDLARDLVRPRDLDAFADHVRAKRTTAYAALRRTLRSARFTELVREWRAALEAVAAQPLPDALTAAELADQRIHRTFRKVARRAEAIGPDPESETIHDLRKVCKELRYLLEVFRPLCDPATFKAVTADFKGLQDVLGEFQDGEVQAAALREFAEEMLQQGSAGAATLLTMGELAARFDERQRSARIKLLDHHMTHLGHSVARHIDHVVASRGSG